MLKKNLLLIILIILTTFPMVAHAVGKKEVQFNCPELHNSNKKSSGQLIQGYNGWFFRESDLKMDFSISPQSLSYMKRINENLKQNDIDFVFLPLLSRALMMKNMINPNDPFSKSYDANIATNSYRNFVNDLNSVGVNTVDVYAAFKNIDEKNIEDYSFKRDIHWKPAGAELVAKKLSDTIKTKPSYNDLSKVKTIIEKGSTISRFGVITEELQGLCKDPITAETSVLYNGKTVLEKNENSLFGSETQSLPVALIGTSFSGVSDFGFPSFLRAESSLDIANFAIAGGGLFTSLISYLSSPYFHEKKPPMIVWETQSIYDFNKGLETSFRQVIPAIHGTCSGDNLIAQSTTSINEGKSYILFDNLSDKNITGLDYYLHLDIDNPVFNKFIIEFEYDDDDGEWFPIDRTDRFNNKGQFYVELSEKIDSNLLRVELNNSQNSQANITAKLCKTNNSKTTSTIQKDKTL